MSLGIAKSKILLQILSEGVSDRDCLQWLSLSCSLQRYQMPQQTTLAGQQEQQAELQKEMDAGESCNRLSGTGADGKQM